MKLHRLLEITTILLNKKAVTAVELAARFGVSTRTIYRDVDALAEAGVPVYTTQGQGGGIAIMEEYAVSRALLSDTEQEHVLMALQSLRATRAPQVDAVLDKLGGLFRARDGERRDWVTVDYTPWGGHKGEAETWSVLRAAILAERTVDIDYAAANGSRTTRRVAPCRLVFKHPAWYLWAYCELRGGWRTFRLSRIRRAADSGARFDRRALPPPEEAAPHEGPPLTRLVLRFRQEALHRLLDDYDDDLLHDNGDGTWTLTVEFPEDEWVYGYLLGFGPSVIVLEPPHIRRLLRERALAVAALYAHDEREE